MNIPEIRAKLDKTRQHVDAIRVRTDALHLRNVLRVARMSKQQRLAALVNRLQFLELGMAACRRQNLWGQAGGLELLMEDVAGEIALIEKGGKAA